MKFRRFGKTDMIVSEVSFGAWGIGGPSIVGDVPIGWGDVDDGVSKDAIRKAIDLGINFFDTADFYGLGHSEELIGEVVSEYSEMEIYIATKVGHKVGLSGAIELDYSKDYIIKACEDSLRRLRRDYIDLYQLHSAKVIHLEDGGCIEAMERLKEAGKIRYWGISLNTFQPEAEAEFLIKNNIGDSFQVVYNIINQRAADRVIPMAQDNNYGVIARMPLQFGILTGKFSRGTVFPQNDHRHFRLPPPLLKDILESVALVWDIAYKYNITKTMLALSFVLQNSGVTTTIPGIKTPEQAEENAIEYVALEEIDYRLLKVLYESSLKSIVEKMSKLG